DLVIAHHPTGGSAILEFPKVLSKHGDILTRHGVPSDAAASAVRELQEEREPRAHAENYDHLPSVARLMGMGLMCIHNPCDEIGTGFYIHIDAGALRRLWEVYGREGPKNLVVTGHLASDSIGINVLVRELRARGLRVDTYSGIIDV